ncbi:hypothetical protein AVEN_141402-1 [Araneus ventricosus]|uniref:DUF19 domain-containing protein n=1 Tax=Araneus ventricosus TaxID=182803 RepID=A0A4Y2D047_ARAVE|nr:hypothetical protein AVEN_141402-1 [Araneus ventricosus]
MASKSNKKALYFFSLLLTVRSQFLVDEVEKSNDGQQHLYPCSTFASCQSEGPEYQKVEECVNLLEPEDLVSSMKTVKSGFYEYESDDLKEALKEYCNFGSERREDAFERTTKGLINHYMAACSSPTQREECSRLDDALVSATKATELTHTSTFK